MNLAEFRHKMDAVYSAYVSARQTAENHDEVIEVIIDAPECGEGISGLDDVHISITPTGRPVMVLSSIMAKAERDAALASEAPADSSESTANKPSTEEPEKEEKHG